MAQDQLEYRWRNDDGTQATATWKAAENTPISLTPDVNVRVRFNSTDSVGGDSWGHLATPLQYRHTPDGGSPGAWTNVTTTSAICKYSASAFLFDNQNTTEQMAGPNTFIAGKCDSNNNWSVTNLAVDPRDTEIEFCVQAVGADLENDDTLELRMANMDTYTVIATATITGLPASNIPGSIFQSNIFGGSVIRG